MSHHHFAPSLLSKRLAQGRANPAVGRNPEAQESFVAVWLPKPSVFSIALVGWFLQDSWMLGGSWVGESQDRKPARECLNEYLQGSVIQGMPTVEVCQIWIETLD